MKLNQVLFYGIAALMAGCLPVVSLNPLVSKGTLVFEPRLVGIWTDEPETRWEFARATTADEEILPEGVSVDKAYRLDFRDEEGRKGTFLACLVKLEDKLFLDIFPRTYPSGQQKAEETGLPYNTLFFVRAHTFVRVDQIGNQLMIRLTDDEAFAKLMEAEPNAISYISGETTPILTASTESLQTFVLRHADDEQLFASEITLTRKAQN
jgi:hypothetical protein